MTRRRLTVVVSCALLALLALIGWSLFIEPRRFVVHQEELQLSRWPPELAGLRVALLSDLHVGSRFWSLARLGELVDATNQQHPDLVLLAGDYVIGEMPFAKVVAPEPIAEVLGQLRAPLGVIAVLGNHDHWTDGPRIETALRSQGIVVLENETYARSSNGRRFYVVGLADVMTRPQHVRDTVKQVPQGEPAIALVHEPDVFPSIEPSISLTVAGHTHGGQVNLPFFGRPIVPSLYGERYAAGHVVEGDRHLFVTTGVGTSIFPIRFRVPPEVAILTLRERPDPQAQMTR